MLNEIQTLTPLLQLGAVGVFLVLFITGRIVPKSVLDKREAEITSMKEDATKDRERLYTSMERTLPAIEAQGNSARELKDEVETTGRRMAELERTVTDQSKLIEAQSKEISALRDTLLLRPGSSR